MVMDGDGWRWMAMDGDEWPLITTDCEIEEANVYGGRTAWCRLKVCRYSLMVSDCVHHQMADCG
jgi:hypothetical protein